MEYDQDVANMLNIVITIQLWKSCTKYNKELRRWDSFVSPHNPLSRDTLNNAIYLLFRTNFVSLCCENKDKIHFHRAQPMHLTKRSLMEVAACLIIAVYVSSESLSMSSNWPSDFTFLSLVSLLVF